MSEKISLDSSDFAYKYSAYSAILQIKAITFLLFCH